MGWEDAISQHKHLNISWINIYFNEESRQKDAISFNTYNNHSILVKFSFFKKTCYDDNGLQ